MIERVDILDVPEASNKVSENYEFAKRSLERFVKSGMEACRVSAWPENKPINRLRATMGSALRHSGYKGTIEVRSDKVNIYLVKVKQVSHGEEIQE